LAILSQTAEETGQTVEQVQDDINEEAENPAVMEEEFVHMGSVDYVKNYEKLK
jgi:hypothetical protein